MTTNRTALPVLGNLTFIVGMAHVKAHDGEITIREASERTHQELDVAAQQLLADILLLPEMQDEVENPKEWPEGKSFGYDYGVCRRAGANKTRAELRQALQDYFMGNGGDK